MDFTDLTYEVRDHVATITLDRPEKMNAGTPAMVMALVEALDAVDADDEVRAVVLTGRGRAFCAGADLSGGAATFDYDDVSRTDAAKDPAPQRPVHRDGAGLVTMRLFQTTKPVIAAVNGAAVGMGATMPLAADIRLASESARFGFVFSKRGIAPEGASTWFLPRLVGIDRAAEWLYTGRVFDAQEALAGGLVRSVHAADDLLPAAYELAAEITDAAPVSVALTRRMLWRMLTVDHPMYAHRVDSRAVQHLGALPDAMEGVMSFLEKRTPAFVGSVSEGLPEIFPDWAEPEFS
ncbi:MAG: crotonase/enoyl-CoA hydratase family protein [Acidimicrobiia bacterium]|nr:crotonase/enoyl-CoA hydratase family protein [Acidimicrobiia bacterium]